MIRTQPILILMGAFLIIFLLGFWLRGAGKPHPGAILTVHKLIALGAGIFLAVNIFRSHQLEPMNPAAITAVIITGLLFLTAGITGGLVSIEMEMPASISLLHKLLPYLTVVSTTATLYFYFYRY